MRVHLLLVPLSLAISTTAYAGAWTQAQGHGQIIFTGLYYATDSLYTNAGHKQSQSRYSKYELNPYFEYGLSDTFTLGANLSLQHARQNTSPDQTNWGLGDSEFFIRTRLIQTNGFTVSAEPMIKLPSPEPINQSPQLGGRHPDAGFGFSLGYGFSTGELNHFADLDAQYRYRFGAPKDQLKLAATLGIGLSSHWMIMPQAFVTQRVTKPALASFTQSSGDDYNLIKLQLSAVYKLTQDTSVQMGGFTHANGANVGAGSGVLVSLWRTF